MTALPRIVAGAATPPAAYEADVIILALDRPAETLEAIHSALAQRGIRRHVTVLDQGSAAATLAAFASAIAGRTDATLLRIDRNLGVAGGRNAATAFGRGRIVAALDNDAEFADAGTLARAVAVLDADPALAAIGLRILAHGSGADDLSSWGYAPGLLAHAGAAFDAVTFVGAGHAIRRAAWDDAGGYDAALFFCWEEYDFCLRAIARGWRVQYRGELAVRHKVSGERRIAWSGDRWFYFVRNRLYIERKYGASWAALLPRMAAYAARGARAGLLRPTLRAVAAAAALAPDARRERSLGAEGRAYLAAHDRAHRGGLLGMIRSEVRRTLPGAA